MLAAVYKKPGESGSNINGNDEFSFTLLVPNMIEVREIETPKLIEKGALIKIDGCGLCSSDIIKIKTDSVSDGKVLGHEAVGEIVELKTDNKNFKVGDRVALGHHVPCFNCNYCKHGSFSMCRTFKKTNIFPGGFAEYITVSEAHLNNTVFKIPEKVSFIRASLTEPAACCLRAVKRAHIKEGDKVFISGLGSIGLLMGQIAKLHGGHTTGCDLIEERLDAAKELGFDEVFKYSSPEESVNFYKSNTATEGADAVFLTSGSMSSLSMSIPVVRDGGKIIVFASVSSPTGCFSNNEIYYRELNVLGSYSPSPKDLEEVFELLVSDKIKLEQYTKVYPLDKINDAIHDSLAGEVIKAYIKL